MTIYDTIASFIYRLQQDGWLSATDAVYVTNRLLAILGLESMPDLPVVDQEADHLTLLDVLVRYAQTEGIIDSTFAAKEQMEARIMDLITPFPSVLNHEFWHKYQEDPVKATDYYYALSRYNDYIKTRNVAKNIEFETPSRYGKLDITINLSKPEKDPAEIAAAAKVASADYPKCLLCLENEGYQGNIKQPARQNHRVIRYDLDGKGYAFQYSPYVYYNEHSIFFNQEHVPMKVDRRCFNNILEIVDLLPHYFVGSNADLPRVGGSILAHDHYQGGHYRFPMDDAAVYDTLAFDGYPDITVELVRWPMSVIRLRSMDRAQLVDLADTILDLWRGYSDAACDIFAETNGEPHNTITPIARRRGEDYELDLVLRNNRVSEAYPDGIFHPHPDVQHIKKENIGLIEVMGLAILPARLEVELGVVKSYLEEVVTLDAVEPMHRDWAEELKADFDPERDDTRRYLELAVGKKFERVLEDAGVYKQNVEGEAGLRRFLTFIQEHLSSR